MAMKGIQIGDHLGEVSDSTRKEYFHGCMGKVQYPTREKAQSAAKTLKKKTQRFRGVEPYQCPFCQFFHLGHPPGMKRQMRPRG